MAREAKCSVDLVSGALSAAGEQATSSSVLELPPNDSCRMRVSFELRYGTCAVEAKGGVATGVSEPVRG